MPPPWGPLERPYQPVVVELIAATTTTTGRTVACEVDDSPYQKGIKVTGAEMDSLSITRDDFHPECNYTITPRI